MRHACLALALLGCDQTEVVQGFPPTFVGVGLELRIDGDAPVVVRALPGGPAEGAGVLPGDQILAVDNHSTIGKNLGDVVMQMRGEPNSQVTLTLQRGPHRITAVVRRRAMSKTTSDYAPTK